jgi:hypothetical protein
VHGRVSIQHLAEDTDEIARLSNKQNSKGFLLLKYYKKMLSQYYVSKNIILNRTQVHFVKAKYAAVVAKSKIEEQDKDPNKMIQKKLHNIHAQLITDFNVIYDNPKQIRLFQIATLHTKSSCKSHNLSDAKNYREQEAPQKITFFPKPLLIKDKLHFVKNSDNYFNKKDIKNVLESNEEYKKLFNKVLDELKSKQIGHRIATIEKDYLLTGFNILVSSQNNNYDKNTYMQILNINHEASK